MINQSVANRFQYLGNNDKIKSMSALICQTMRKANSEINNIHLLTTPSTTCTAQGAAEQLFAVNTQNNPNANQAYPDSDRDLLTHHARLDVILCTLIIHTVGIHTYPEVIISILDRHRCLKRNKNTSLNGT